MINLAASAIPLEGLTLFPDDGDERRWYFVPARPRVTTGADGKADFQLVKYRRIIEAEGPTGGGALTLGVELGASPQSVERALAGLRARHPGVEVTLQPVIPDRVTCEVRLGIGANEGPLSGPQVASTDPPHRAAVQASLSMPGTTLFESALNTGVLGGSVVYRLTLTARRPALKAVVMIDWTRVGEFFAAQTDAHGSLSSAQIEAAVAQLVELRAVRIEVQAGTSDDLDASTVMGEAMRQAVTLVGARLFNGTRSSDGTATYDLNQPGAGQQTLTIADTLGNMLAAIPAANRPAVTLVEEEPWSFEVSVRGLFQPGDGVRLIEVTLASGDRSVELLLSPERPDGTAKFLKSGQHPDFQYSYRVLLGMDAPVEASRTRFEAGARTTDLRTIVIDPRELMKVVRINAVAMFPFDLYRAAFVDVNVDVPAEQWSTSRSLRLDDSSPDASFSIAFGHASTAAIQHRIRHVTRAGAVIEGAWQTTDPVAIIVGIPAGAGATA